MGDDELSMGYYIAIVAVFLLACGVVALYLSNTTINHVYVVERYGYKNVGILGRAWLGCTDADNIIASRRFVATGPDDIPVSGSVCCGWIYKDCTLRLNTW